MSIELWAARLERPLTDRETAELLRLLPEERRQRLERLARLLGGESQWSNPYIPGGRLTPSPA